MADTDNTENLKLDVSQPEKALADVSKQVNAFVKQLQKADSSFKGEGFRIAITNARNAGRDLQQIISAYASSFSDVQTKLSMTALRTNEAIEKRGTVIGQQAAQLRLATKVIKEAASVRPANNGLLSQFNSAAAAAERLKAATRDVAALEAQITATRARRGNVGPANGAITNAERDANLARQQLLADLEREKLYAADLLNVQRQLTEQERAQASAIRQAAAEQREQTARARQSVAQATFGTSARNSFFSGTNAGRAQIATVRAGLAESIGDSTGALTEQRKALVALREEEIRTYGVGTEAAKVYSTQILKINEQLAAQRAEQARPSLGDRFGSQALRVANYAVIGIAISAALELGKQLLALDQKLHDFQGATNASESQLEKLRQKILETAKSSSYTVAEVADATVQLARSGLNVEQVTDSLRGVTLYAQANNVELTESVKLMTTAIGAFGLRAEETTNLANLFTAAINKTKLTAEQLQQGFESSAATAAGLGISVQELTTAFALMANAGLRSGSSSVAFRQVLDQLSAPSARFAQILRQLGLTMDDIDVQSHGLLGVLAKLRDSGFTASDAFQAFGTRGATAFIALNSQAKNAFALEASLSGTAAASLAVQKQMDGVEASTKQLGSAIVGLTSNIFSGLVPGFVLAEKAATEIITRFGQLIGWLNPLTTSTDAYKNSQEGVNTAVDEAHAKYANLETQYQELLRDTQTLVGRQHDLHDGSDALKAATGELADRYGNLGVSVADLSNKYVDLVARMREARNLSLNLQTQALNDLNVETKKQFSLAQGDLQNSTGTALAAKLPDYPGSLAQKLGLYNPTGALRNAAPGQSTPTLDALLARATSSSASLSYKDIPQIETALRELNGLKGLSQAAQGVVSQYQSVVSDLGSKVGKVAGLGSNLNSQTRGLSGQAAAATPQFAQIQTNLQNLIAQANNNKPADTGRDDVVYEAALAKYQSTLHAQIQGFTAALNKYVGNDPAKRAAVEQAGMLSALSELESNFQVRTQAALTKAKQQLDAKAEDTLGAIEAEMHTQTDLLSHAKTVAAAQTAAAKLQDLNNQKIAAQAAKKATDLGLGPNQYSVVGGQLVVGENAKLDTTHGYAVNQFNREAAANTQTLTDQIQEKIESISDHAGKKAASDAATATQQTIVTVGQTISEVNKQIADRLKEITKTSTPDQIKQALEDASKLLDHWYQLKLQELNDQIKKASEQGHPLSSENIAQRQAALQAEYQSKSGELSSAGSKDLDKSAVFLAQQSAMTLTRQLATLSDKIAEQFKTIDANTPISVVKEHLAQAQALLAQWYADTIAKINADAVKNKTPAGDLDAQLTAAGQDYQSRQTDLSAKGQELLNDQNQRLPANMTDAYAGIQKALADPRQTINNSQVSQFATTFQDTMVAAITAVRTNMGQMWSDWATGAQTAGDAFKAFAKGILVAIMNTLSNQLTQQFFNLIGSAMGGGSAGGAGGAGGSVSSTVGAGTSGVGGGAAGIIQSIGDFIGKLFHDGGTVPAFARGGLIRGAIGTRDSVFMPARSGDFIMRKSAVQAIGLPALDAINRYASGGVIKAQPGEYHIDGTAARIFGLDNLKEMNRTGNVRHYSTGGSVGDVIGSGVQNRMDSLGRMTTGHQLSGASMPKGAHMATNVYVVAPNQQPPTTPNDIVVAISQDILKNGITKQLIKTVQQGG